MPLTAAFFFERPVIFRREGFVQRYDSSEHPALFPFLVLLFKNLAGRSWCERRKM